MTLSLPRAERISIFASALVYTAATFAVATSSTPAIAADGPYYTAVLAQPTDENRAVAGGVAWACKGTTCVANKGTSRPIRMCRGLSKELGEVASFTAKGKELEAGKLAKCNGK
ncbi:hypothetical protein [Erythrobacter sp. YT30]|uniref:CC_3452 family protein n=1 Tax=Erythrobacter sp. YT30 TaxID=1735012 RepID=UPI00076D2342|nr:hypothetical protein [Erythrobacter sp. YT30]KWV91141.1 hypothetical protein AUC45_07455 [Erythrobacter sp. YT30]